ncbi:MAG: hypothetical protein ABIT09_11755 [Croceibacterium sp.]
MVKAVALARNAIAQSAEPARLTIVLACVAALIVAERALPLL